MCDFKKNGKAVCQGLCGGKPKTECPTAKLTQEITQKVQGKNTAKLEGNQPE